MKNNKTIIGVFAAILGILLIAVLAINYQGKKRYNWQENYRSKRVQPYGTSILLALLKDFYPDKTLEESKSQLRLIGEWEAPLNYVAIGQEIYYDDDDVNKLLEIVDEGNNALIICKYIPWVLVDYITDPSCYEHFFYEQFAKEAKLNFKDSLLHSEQGYSYRFKKRDEFLEYSWTYFDSLVCDSNIEILGSNLDTLSTFVRIPYGEGNFYLHGVPLAFSNLHLLDSSNLEYVEKVFSYLPEATIYWDEHSKISYFDGAGDSSGGPLQYILAQDSLRWAWYLLLALVVLYVISFGKRKQKLIPVLEQLENTSIEFTETIGELYYQQQNHRKLGLLKMKLFLEYIRNHYYLNTNQIDENLIKKIVTKSELPKEHVSRIFATHTRMLETAEVSTELLIGFNSALENFYENCK